MCIGLDIYFYILYNLYTLIPNQLVYAYSKFRFTDAVNDAL